MSIIEKNINIGDSPLYPANEKEECHMTNDKQSMTEARKRANAKHDKENFQYITFKARKGARERIVEAATATGQSTNGFIRSTLNKAVQDATGAPMEYVEDEKTSLQGVEKR